MKYIAQKKGTMDCGPVAILNTGAWLGNRPKKNLIKIISEEVGVDPKDGTSGTKLNKWLRQKRNLGTNAVIHPTHSEILQKLKAGKGVILQYVYVYDGIDKGHFAFLSLTSTGKIRLANPDRASVSRFCPAPISFTYISKSRLAELCHIRNRYGHQYPRMWVINNDQRNDFIRLTDRLNQALRNR